MAERTVIQVVPAQETLEGAGVKIRRTIGTPNLKQHDPFLLLDEFKSADRDDYGAGFPEHPHRGFETVTYMLAGEMQHTDHLGHTGNISAGGVQWMTAGRGIVHAEMPKQEDGLMWGFQLWINLPSALKMCEPRYQDIPAAAVPVKILDGGVTVRVIAGQSRDVIGPVQDIITEPIYLDVAIPLGCSFQQKIPAGYNTCCYVFEGEAIIGANTTGIDSAAGTGRLVVLSDGDYVSIQAAACATRLLLLAAKPIGEPVARYGPFVMNTRAELVQAAEDFKRGEFTQ
jgi:redox-sensitive bicupin YhaK (pirin superfamily)